MGNKIGRVCLLKDCEILKIEAKIEKMIKKEKKLIITFHTTVEAMMMETVCKENRMDGRLIPVPGFILAGCGLAWCAKPDKEKELRDLMDVHGIFAQQIQCCMI